MAEAVALMALGLCAACGEEAMDGGVAPEISSLELTPTVVALGRSTAVLGSVEFLDANGDLDEITVEVSAPDGTVFVEDSSRIPRGDPRFPVKKGVVQFGTPFLPLEEGEYVFDVSLTDRKDHRSNHLTGEVTATAHMVQTCAPGTEEPCPCDGDYSGYRICSDDGTKFGACLGCPVDPEPQPDGGVTGNACANVGSVPVLGYDIVDAEYDAALDRIVLVSVSPSVLRVLDPVTGKEETVALPTPPTSVSVGPDGTHAAVGHDGHVTYVDLQAGSIVSTWPVTTDSIDVVLAGNGYVYVFPRTDQWETIRSIKLSDGEETKSDASLIYAGTVAKLAPGKLVMYGADRGLSPSDIARYDISAGTAQLDYDSPYHGDHAMCGDLWLSEDATRIFTRCGNVFRASDLQQNDMTYAGSLAGLEWITHLSHSALAKVVVAVGGTREFRGTGTEYVDGDWEIRVFSDDFYEPGKGRPLPCVDVAGRNRRGHGRFVFVRSDGSEYYAIVGADNDGAAPIHFGVATIEP